MNKIFTISLAFCALNGFSQSYAPPANTAGTTAMHTDSSAFVAWATGIDIKRGFLNIADTNFMLNGSNKASYGSPTEALNQAEGSSATVVSLGDGGMATLTFAQPITNGAGPDFAVFENSFQPDFLELAFVEVSSDGGNFFRFPAHSENQFTTQIPNGGLMDCRYINNLAGKYEQGYGTPFDLSDLQPNLLLDLNAITHVRIVDVIGTINPEFASTDSEGNIVNDPYPTDFGSGGFDLDGVGVINQKALGLDENEISVEIYPNPSAGMIQVKLEQPCDVEIVDLTGKVLISMKNIQNEKIDLEGFGSGVYLVEIFDRGMKAVKRIVVE